MKLLSSLWFEKESGKWHPDGKHSFPHIGDRYDGAASDDFPSDQLMVCAVLARRYKHQTEQLQAQQESRANKA